MKEEKASLPVYRASFSTAQCYQAPHITTVIVELL
jgi:hypothetical protein